MSSNTNINNPKCSNCKCYFTPTLKSSGQPFKTCDKCRIQDKNQDKTINVSMIKENQDVFSVVGMEYANMIS